MTKLLNTKLIVDMYINGSAASHIGKLIGVDTKTILLRLRKAGVEIRPKGGWNKGMVFAPTKQKPEKKRREFSPTLSSHGYARVTTGVRKRKYVHIMVAEKALGRSLRKGEVVHHIDMNKLNNSPSNLLVCTIAYHQALHARMRRHDFWKVLP